jgi:hypothetical protein
MIEFCFDSKANCSLLLVLVQSMVAHFEHKSTSMLTTGNDWIPLIRIGQHSLSQEKAFRYLDSLDRFGFWVQVETGRNFSGASEKLAVVAPEELLGIFKDYSENNTKIKSLRWKCPN